MDSHKGLLVSSQKFYFYLDNLKKLIEERKQGWQGLDSRMLEVYLFNKIGSLYLADKR